VLCRHIPWLRRDPTSPPLGVRARAECRASAPCIRVSSAHDGNGIPESASGSRLRQSLAYGRMEDDRLIRLVDYCHAHGHVGDEEDPAHVSCEHDRITADRAGVLVLVEDGAIRGAIVYADRSLRPVALVTSSFSSACPTQTAPLVLQYHPYS
jgi:hypothetical protein